MEFISKELAIKLNDKGFNERPIFSYVDEQLINPKVIEEYGYLSDDGYYELTKNCGGELDFDYVYIYETIVVLTKDTHCYDKNVFPAYTIDQVLEWLRGKNIHIRVDRSYLYNNTISKDGEIISVIERQGPFWNFLIRNIETGECLYENDMKENKYNDYNECIIKGIEYIVDNLIK